MAIQSPFWLPGRQGQKPPPQSVTDSPRTALCRAWAHAGHLREPGLEQGVKEMNDAQEVGNRESREWACVHEPIAPGHLDCSARPSWALLAVRWPLSGCLDTPSLERRQLHACRQRAAGWAGEQLQGEPWVPRGRITAAHVKSADLGSPSTGGNNPEGLSQPKVTAVLGATLRLKPRPESSSQSHTSAHGACVPGPRNLYPRARWLQSQSWPQKSCSHL